MRNFFKFFGIIAMVAIIGFSMVGCDGDDDGGGGTKTLSGTVTAGNFFYDPDIMDSNISISYGRADMYSSYTVPDVVITTDLPYPNDSFTLTFASGGKEITGLTYGQTVNWTATVSTGSINADVNVYWLYITYKP